MRQLIVILCTLQLTITACSDVEMLDAVSTLGTNNAVGETPTVYARIARSARNCWFKPGGLIKKTHMFYATAEPQAKGGKAEISIRLRNKKGGPGPKAFLVSLVPSGSNTIYATRNITLDERTAAKMSRDVKRWANAELGCAPARKRDWAPVAPNQSAR